jgi:RimJ/RimL family protein N-acetyltransferase
MRGSGSTYKVRGAQERVLPESLRATQRELRKAKERLRQKANIGYEIAPGYWGERYATEAARLMVTFGFREARLHRI